MSKKKNGNGNGNGFGYEVNEDGAYPKWVKEAIKEQIKNEERKANGKNGEPITFNVPRSWMAPLCLLFFYTGFITVTCTCVLSKVLYLV